MKFPNNINGCGIASLEKFYGREFTTNKDTYTQTIVFARKKFRTCKTRTIILIHLVYRKKTTRPALHFFFADKMRILQKPTAKFSPIDGTLSRKQLEVFRVMWPIEIMERQNSLCPGLLINPPGLGNGNWLNTNSIEARLKAHCQV